MKSLRILLVLCLLFVLSLHTIHFDHDHPGHIFGDGIQAVFHGEDKKWFSVLPPTPALSPLPLFLIFTTSFSGALFVFAHPDPVRLALAEGRIQAKLYE